MKTIQEIKSAIVELNSSERESLRVWWDDVDATYVDLKLIAAIDSGYFDTLAFQARRDFVDSKCREI